MKVFRVGLSCLILVLLALTVNSCKTPRKHKCKDCPTFTHIENCKLQPNDLYET